MRSGLAAALRNAATAALPSRAFLRRDRDDALFVSNAPALCPNADWAGALTEAGFACEVCGGLLRLWPDAGWLTRLEMERPEPPDSLCESLRRFAGLPPDGESVKLFALGARALDGGDGGGRFDRLLRRRAAQCLRLNRTEPDGPTRGGGLYACALLNHIIKEDDV